MPPQPNPDSPITQTSGGPVDLNVVALKGSDRLAFESPLERVIGGRPDVRPIYICSPLLPSLISKYQKEDLKLLVELKRLQLGGSDSSGSDSEDSGDENVKSTKEVEEVEADETINRSIRLPGHLSASM